MSSKTVHKLALPTVGAELFTYLKNVNDSEAFTASMRIKDTLSVAIKVDVTSWFGIPALPELDQSLLRKLTNSLLAAGEAGNSRTLEALREIRFETTPMTQPLSRDDAVAKLRLATRDYRSAKGFLENNHKCINSFMKLNRAINDENIRDLLKMSIRNQEDFASWNGALIKYWEQKANVKSALRSSYLTIFQKYISTFESDLSNSRYRDWLDTSIRNYVDLELDSGSTVSFADSAPSSIEDAIASTASVQVHFHINEGEIEYEATFLGYTKLQISSIRIKLALLLQKETEFSNLKLIVSMGTGDSSKSIFVRTRSQLSEAQIVELTNFLENEFTNPDDLNK